MLLYLEKSFALYPFVYFIQRFESLFCYRNVGRVSFCSGDKLREGKQLGQKFTAASSHIKHRRRVSHEGNSIIFVFSILNEISILEKLIIISKPFFAYTFKPHGEYHVYHAVA